MVHELRNRRIALILTVLMVALLIPSASYAKSYGEADPVSYSTSQDKELDFDEDDFNKVCDDLTGNDLDYVKFSLPSSSKGTLYYNFDTASNSDKVSESKKYYYDSSLYLSKVTFVPEDDYEGTVTIDYTGCDEDGNTFTGTVKIKVTESGGNDADDLEYSIKSDEALDFDEDDFNEACDDANGKDLDYVKFTLPSSSSGTLYYKYKSKDNYYSKADTDTKYYYDDSPSISEVTFVPKSDYEGTVVIKYTGYDVKKNSFSGKIRIEVKEGASSDGISYSVGTNKTVDFDEDDFNDICEDENDQELDYVKFTLPSSTKGILYFDYDDGEYDSKVSESKEYYYDEKPNLSKITFVPNKNYSGVCKIDYKGYDVKGKTFTGAVEITVNGGTLLSADMISYTGKAGNATYFKDQDFNNACKKLTGKTLDYVKFKLPSSSSGKLYFGYTSSSSSEASDSIKYYYGATPYLLNIAYVPAGSATGTTVIEYTGYDTEGSAYSGKVQITVSSGSTTTTGSGINTNLKKSQYFKDVDEAYSWAVDYIDSLYVSGVITGSSNGGSMKFNPASKITRGDFLLFLCRALNLQTNTSSGNFSDVSKGSYYYDAIATAKAMGIALGSDNKFYPNSSITREDAMVLALRAMNKSGKAVSAADVNLLSSYSDKNVVSDYARESVAALINSGIVTGSDDNKLHPAENISRIQAVAIIYRIKNK